MRQLFIQYTAHVKSKQLLVKVRPLTRSFGSHQPANYKGPEMTSVKQFKQEKQRYYLYKKRETLMVQPTIFFFL